MLLVKNTYGRRDVWHLPGGGFNPDKETVESAAQRELFEELGVENVAWLHLGDYKTEAQGKRDNVAILSCVLTTTTLSLGSEIASAEWVNNDAIGKAYKVYEVTRFALNLDRQSVTKAEVV